MTIEQMKYITGTKAEYMRAWFLALAPEERFPAKEVGNEVAEKFPKVSFGTLKRYWQELKNKGLVESEKNGNSWEFWLTEEGTEFWEWLMTDEGIRWGKPRSSTSSSGVTFSARDDWTLGELGFVVEDKLPFDLWRRISKDIKAKGYRTVIVPPEGKVYLGVVKDGKSKAVKIPTWNELNGPKEEKKSESIEEKRARLEAELAALKEEA